MPATTIIQLKLNLTNFLLITQDSLYVRAYLNSVWIAAVATFWTLLVGLPDRLRHGQGARRAGGRSC